jgi:hypothetical protein
MIRPQRFTARKLNDVETKPGCWHQQRIGVFDADANDPSAPIHTYVYGYSSGLPFYAFEQDGQWYALFSGENYTKTDIMTLPDGKVVGGEALVPHGCGFCPVEFYVPAFFRFTYEQTHDAGVKLDAPRQAWLRMYDDRAYTTHEDDQPPETPRRWTHERFGFRCGCVWGDDSSWKLQLLDLSRVKDGIVEEIDIGYIELAPYPLQECLEFLDDGDDGIYSVRVSTINYHNLEEALTKIKVPNGKTDPL